jgi:hypothetical protein
MTAATITLGQYLQTLRQTIPYVHPSGKVTIDGWLNDMETYADQNDGANFAKLAQLITTKVNHELSWQDNEPDRVR